MMGPLGAVPITPPPERDTFVPNRHTPKATRDAWEEKVKTGGVYRPAGRSPGEKHGPGGTGDAGPCDADCLKCAREKADNGAMSRAMAAVPPWVCQQCSTHNLGGTRCICGALPVGVERLSCTQSRYNGVADLWPSTPADIMKEPYPPDPLDVEYDDFTLRELLALDRIQRREAAGQQRTFTPAQRAAISAHWSAQLRAKVAASDAAAKERDRNQVVLEGDPEDSPW